MLMAAINGRILISPLLSNVEKYLHVISVLKEEGLRNVRMFCCDMNTRDTSKTQMLHHTCIEPSFNLQSS